MLELLLDAGGLDLELADEGGANAVAEAESANQVDAALLLVQRGAALPRNFHGMALLVHVAAEVRDAPAARRAAQALIVGAAGEVARLHRDAARLGPLCKAQRTCLAALREETAAEEARLAAAVAARQREEAAAGGERPAAKRARRGPVP